MSLILSPSSEVIMAFYLLYFALPFGPPPAINRLLDCIFMLVDSYSSPFLARFLFKAYCLSPSVELRRLVIVCYFLLL